MFSVDSVDTARGPESFLTRVGRTRRGVARGRREERIEGVRADSMSPSREDTLPRNDIVAAASARRGFKTRVPRWEVKKPFLGFSAVERGASTVDESRVDA